MTSNVLAKSLESAEEEKRRYRWTGRLISNVYSDPKSVQNRKRVAHLFVGEWAKYLDEVGEETHIRFRGGEGYVSSECLGKERFLEIYFIDVGQGDSILIQTADDRRILIDGGKDRSAYSFLRWKYNLKKYYVVFDAVIMTHGDADHAGGLISFLNDSHVIVKTIYHNGIAKRSDGGLGRVSENQDGDVLVDLYDDIEDLVPKYDQLTKIYKDWVDAVMKAKRRVHRHGLDFECCRVDQNKEDVIIGGQDGLRIKFLGPINIGDEDTPRLKTFGSVSKTINGNSVALMLEYRRARILLCGDMNEPAEELFLRHCDEGAIRAHVFKANHHGSQHFTTEFLNSVKPWVTVVSSGDFPDYGHPRASLLGSLGHYAPPGIEKPLLFSTEIAATFKKIPESKLEERGSQLYEKTIHGMINVRSDGNWLAAGRVYGKTEKKIREDKPPRSIWKWEAYAFNLENGESLKNKLLAN